MAASCRAGVSLLLENSCFALKIEGKILRRATYKNSPARIEGCFRVQTVSAADFPQRVSSKKGEAYHQAGEKTRLPSRRAEALLVKPSHPSSLCSSTSDSQLQSAQGPGAFRTMASTMSHSTGRHSVDSDTMDKFRRVMEDVFGRANDVSKWTPKPYKEGKGRYLWTDAYGVCNFLTLFYETGEPKFLQQVSERFRKWLISGGVAHVR
jgi:hypothetical protein